MLFGSLAKIYFRKWRFEFFKIFSKPIKKKNIFLYYYGQVFKRHGIDEKRIIKKITSINKVQSRLDSDINKLCESEKEFDNISEIENSDDTLWE